MKPNSTLRSFLLLASSSLLAATSIHAATLTWDANGATALQTDGVAVSGNWDTGTNWWNGSTNVSWTTGDSAIFGNGGAGGAVGLTASTAVASLTFNYFTGTYTLGTTLQGITLTNGITKNAAVGIATIISPLTLSAAQTWTNHTPTTDVKTAAGSLVVGTATDGINNGGFLLTFDGAGVTQFKGSITGIGGLSKNGSGTLILGANPNPAQLYTGTTTINGGVVRTGGGNNGTGTGNLTINNGYLESYFGSTFTRTLGAGPGEVQILGGVSGFSEQGSGATYTFNNSAAFEVVWGAANFFNPSTLVLQGDTVNAGKTITVANKLDLNATTRSIYVGQGSTTAATISGVIRTSSGTAGLTKIGLGNLVLSNANTYNGDTTINGGLLTLSGSGTLASTSALKLGGGTLRLVNTAQVNRFADVAVTVSAGGGITYENTNTAAITYTETLGAVTVSGGLLNVVQSNNQSTSNGQTLTFGTSGSTNLTQSGTGAVAFSATGTGTQITGNKNMIVVFGSGTTTAGQIIGPWATTGLAANAQRDYAVFSGDYITSANIAASGEGSWTTLGDNFTMDSSGGVITLTGTRNIASLRNTVASAKTIESVTTTTGVETVTITGHGYIDGTELVFGPGAPGGLTAGTKYYVKGATANTFQLSALADLSTTVDLTNAGTANNEVALFSTTNSQLTLATGANLGTTGILNGSSFAMTIAPGTGGVVTLPTTSAGQLHVTTGSGAITMSAPVTDNTGALTLVKNGSAGNLILNGANTFTGGIAINAGTLQIGTNGTANGANLNSGNYAGNIFIGAGANLDFQTNSNQTLSGIISGDGNLLKRYIGTLTLSNINTYTGKTTIGAITNAGDPTLVVSSFNSVNGGTPLLVSSSLGAPTTIANGTIDIGSNNSSPNPTLKYSGAAATGETTDRVINIIFNSAATRTLDASNASGLLKFTSAFTSNGTATGHLVLKGSGNAEIAHGLPFAFTNLTKSDAGTWTLGGAVGNTGTTTISGGTLALGASNILSNTSAISLGTATLNAATFSDTLGTLDPTTTGATINLGSGAALAFANSSAVVWTGGTLNITGTFVSGSSLRFGTTDAGLTDTQLGLITATGFSSFDLNSNGYLTAVPDGGGSAYDTWKAANAPGSNPDDDTDGDGVTNAVEFVLGGTSLTNDLDKLPTPATSGGNLTFTFKRDVDSIDPKTALFIETSTDLAIWNNAPSPYTVPDVAVANNPGVTVVEDTPSGFDTVTLTVPQDVAKKFARLKVVITP